MRLIYNIGILLYINAIWIASFFNHKAKLWIKGRKNIFSEIKKTKRGTERLVWFHASSLGEFEQGRPVMEELKEKEPATKILLTFFSPSGYEIRKNYQGADYVFYLPADTPANAAKFVKYFRPDVAVFVKYEFWFNYLNVLHSQKIPTYIISAIFRKNQIFFKAWGGFYRNILHLFNLIFVQNEESAKLLASINVCNYKITGDTRFNRVKQIADSAKTIEKAELFCKGEKAIICGSTWQPDEELLFSYINNSNDNNKWIIAPHEIGGSHIKGIVEKSQRKIAKLSDNVNTIQQADVLIIDCIGLLSAVYRYGKLAYIGGGFGVGIHNTLEAAVYGLPVVFGSNYKRFNEAVELINSGGGFSVNNEDDLHKIFDNLLNDEETRTAAGQHAGNYVLSHLGATKAIIEIISTNL
ncbi:MAG: 3-deoxy-D-manno-octulosonic acid transferase [Culturomica sp.]|jgi:3-deoxy-D-manno-octulosonic-acid transferase|nr:3-deoxy-D-manno-octulosonic acid transferase [Culturomica sp.]